MMSVLTVCEVLKLQLFPLETIIYIELCELNSIIYNLLIYLCLHIISFSINLLLELHVDFRAIKRCKLQFIFSHRSGVGSSSFIYSPRYICFWALVEFVLQDSLYISPLGKEGMHQAHENPINFIDQLKQTLI